MTGTPSAWVDFRNAVESIVEPPLAAGLTLVKAIVDDEEAAATGNLETAFENGLAAFAAAPGALEVRVFAFLSAFAEKLLGEAVTVAKAAA